MRQRSGRASFARDSQAYGRDGASVQIVTRGEELKDLTVYRIKRGPSGRSGRE
jgi:hypothetical protein